MAHNFPLQAGDVSSERGRRDASPAGDRREQNIESEQSVTGTNAAPQAGKPMYPLFPVGSLEPSSFLAAPFPVIKMEGDTSGEGTKIHEIDIYSYGDNWDSTAPIRVRTVDNYDLDSDFDGHKN